MNVQATDRETGALHTFEWNPGWRTWDCPGVGSFGKASFAERFVPLSKPRRPIEPRPQPVTEPPEGVPILGMTVEEAEPEPARPVPEPEPGTVAEFLEDLLGMDDTPAPEPAEEVVALEDVADEAPAAPAPKKAPARKKAPAKKKG